MKKQAFSLVELVIVISILGLLVTAVVGGVSIIGQAKLRAIKTEVDNIIESTYIFDNAYGYLPGDMPNFSDIANHDENCVKSSANTATANGNGNRQIEYAAPTGGKTYVEGSAFWCHLKMTGSNYGTGTIAKALATVVIGQNIPASKISSAIGYAAHYEASIGNHLLLLGAGSTVGTTLKSALTTKQAHKIKAKFDNTMTANVGDIRVENGDGKTCLSGTTITTATKGKACVLRFFLIH